MTTAAGGQSGGMVKALVLSLVLGLLLAGCAGDAAHREGVALVSAGRWEEALPRLEQASREAPGNREFRIHYLNARAALIGRLLAEARSARLTGQDESARALFRQVLVLDSGNDQAEAGLAGVDRDQRHRQWLAEARQALRAGDAQGAGLALARVLGESPRQDEALALRRELEDATQGNGPLAPALRQTFQRPVTLEFRDTSLRQILEVLSRHAGLNFILDKDVPANLTVTVFLRQVSVADALEVMLGTHQLRSRVLNDSTLLIYPDTTAKQGEHQELVVKQFFLANAEAKQVMSMLKTVLKAKTLFADDKLNLLIMRDTPAMVRLAERLVTTQDVSEPEVMLELEVLEVQRSRLLNLGIQFPSQLTLAPLPSTPGAALTLGNLQHLNADRTGATVSNAVLNLQRVVSDTNLLANPRIRTHNREKALIRIGDRVPVITTTATSTGFISENVQYVDVGLKLEVEPTIYPNDEIAIKLALEVSSVTKELTSKSGTVSYQIGGRNASTVLRLKDGETQILGGLINDQDIRAANRFPGLGDLPVLGRLFSSQKDSQEKTELILSVTPRLVRSLAPPPHLPDEFWSGTENDPRLVPPGLARQAVLPLASSPLPPVGTPPPAQPPPAAFVLRWEGPDTVAVGQTFALHLHIDAAQALSSLPLHIDYDPAVFALVKVQSGKFMGQGEAIVETSQPPAVDTGQLRLTQTRDGTQGASGQGEVLELVLRALAPAPASLIQGRAGPTLHSDGSPPAAGGNASSKGVTVTP